MAILYRRGWSRRIVQSPTAGGPKPTPARRRWVLTRDGRRVAGGGAARRDVWARRLDEARAIRALSTAV